MNIAYFCAAKRLLNSLLPVLLLAGCAATRTEPPAQTSPGPYPDLSPGIAERSNAASPVPEEPPVSSGPSLRRHTFPLNIDRSVPERTPAPAHDAARSRMPQIPLMAPARPPSPTPVHVCDPGGCFDPGGIRYDGGVGNIYLDRNGKTCQRMGSWMQCN